MVIFWSLAARDDLKVFTTTSPRYAIRVTQDILEKTKTLPELPQLGKVVSEISEDNLREISLYSYRIIYEVMPDAIYIHGVVHKRRNFKAEDLER